MSEVPWLSAPLLDAVAGAVRGGAGTEPAGTASAPIVVLDELLTRPELDDLVEWVVGHERDFGTSQVISATGTHAQLNSGHRRSRVVFAPAALQAVFAERLMSVLDHVRGRLGLPAFPVAEIEVQITASNDGEFFRAHTDDGHPALTRRRLTYVYFCHREPAAFTGGRLRFFRTAGAGGRPTPGAVLAEVVPRQNQVVFFPSHYYHEIETVRCPSRRFVDSRFTVNGWYRSP
jgi:SM-20-related protein